MSISIDPNPILSTSILTVFDERPLSQLQALPGGVPSLFTTYTIPIGVAGISTVLLRENPQQQSAVVPTGVSVIQVPGGPFTEVLTTPGSGQYVVNYINGSLIFNGADAGKVITATYTGLGSEVRAETINNMNALLVPLYNIVNTFTTDGLNFTFENVTVTGNLIAEALDRESVFSSDPGSPITGQIWFNTTDNQFKGWNGSAVVILG